MMSYERSYGDDVPETYADNAQSSQYSIGEYPPVPQYMPQSPYQLNIPSQPPIYGFMPPYVAVTWYERGRNEALVGLILGICSLIFFWFFPIASILAIAGIVTSNVGRCSISRRGMATAGLVLSILALIITIVVGFAIFVISMSAAYN